MSPPEAETHVARSTDDATHQAVALRLRRELDNVQHKAEMEISGRDQEIARLKGQVGKLKEKVTVQGVELKECLRALGEVKRENTAEMGVCRREGALAEHRASSMQARLGAAAANSERVFGAANAQLEAVKNERNALAEALAATASAVMGGANVTLEDLALDAEAAILEAAGGLFLFLFLYPPLFFCSFPNEFIHSFLLVFAKGVLGGVENVLVGKIRHVNNVRLDDRKVVFGWYEYLDWFLPSGVRSAAEAG